MMLESLGKKEFISHFKAIPIGLSTKLFPLIVEKYPSENSERNDLTRSSAELCKYLPSTANEGEMSMIFVLSCIEGRNPWWFAEVLNDVVTDLILTEDDISLKDLKGYCYESGMHHEFNASFNIAKESIQNSYNDMIQTCAEVENYSTIRDAWGDLSSNDEEESSCEDEEEEKDEEAMSNNATEEEFIFSLNDCEVYNTSTDGLTSGGQSSTSEVVIQYNRSTNNVLGMDSEGGENVDLPPTGSDIEN